MMELDRAKVEKVSEEVTGKTSEVQEEADVISEEEPKASMGGLMGATPEELAGPASADEQDSMLGYGPDEDQSMDDEEVLA